MKRVNEIAFACGRKGSGKSHWLNCSFVEHSPRVIHIDPNGEYLHDKHVLPARDYYELVEMVDAFCAAGTREWRIAVSLDGDDMPRLFELVAPTADFGKDSISRHLGGLAIECGECDMIAPNGRTHSAVASAWRRGRHHGLSLFMGTQRPSSCDRLLTSQADVVACFAQSEAIDIDWCRRTFGKAAADAVAQLEPHWCVLKRSGTAEFEIINPAGQVTRRVSTIGR